MTSHYSHSITFLPLNYQFTQSTIKCNHYVLTPKKYLTHNNLDSILCSHSKRTSNTDNNYHMIALTFYTLSLKHPKQDQCSTLFTCNIGSIKGWIFGFVGDQSLGIPRYCFHTTLSCVFPSFYLFQHIRQPLFSFCFVLFTLLCIF